MDHLHELYDVVLEQFFIVLHSIYLLVFNDVSIGDMNYETGKAILDVVGEL